MNQSGSTEQKEREQFLLNRISELAYQVGYLEGVLRGVASEVKKELKERIESALNTQGESNEG